MQTASVDHHSGPPWAAAPERVLEELTLHRAVALLFLYFHFQGFIYFETHDNIEKFLPDMFKPGIFLYE